MRLGHANDFECFVIYEEQPQNLLNPLPTHAGVDPVGQAFVYGPQSVILPQDSPRAAAQAFIHKRLKSKPIQIVFRMILP